MLDEYDYDEYWGMFPPEREYPPIIPAELTACLGNAPKMIVECDRLKSMLDKALEKIRLTKHVLDGRKRGAKSKSVNGKGGSKAARQ